MRRNLPLGLLALVFSLASLFLWAVELPRVVIVATGGTIAMRLDSSGAPVPAINGEDLVGAVPELRELAEIKVVNFSNIPSDYMDPERWIRLSKLVSRELANPEVTGVVVTHGTDTLEETAYFLDLTLDTDKPVVCIGAQRNASERDSDGPRNLRNAVRQILSPGARNKGVTITMNHQIHAARDATKSHTSNVQSFDSGEQGPLGVVDLDQVIFYRTPLRRFALEIPSRLPRVELISMYPGADGNLLRHVVDSGAKGVVVSALGMGNVNPDLFDAIQYSLDKEIPIVICSRVPNGRVLPVYGFEGGGATLKKIGALFGNDLPPWKARILLMLALAKTGKHEELQELLDR